MAKMHLHKVHFYVIADLLQFLRGGGKYFLAEIFCSVMTVQMPIGWLS